MAEYEFLIDFFFQAEDGIRDIGVTGVQTCALPIFDATWVHDLDISFAVGLFDYSFWLVGLTALVTVAAIGYGMWVGRERPRAYFGLLLFLAGATVGVFTAQDLLLFYVFFEAMLIPLYVLIGVWGGIRRATATIKFVIYTLAGSLLMLIAIIALGLENGTFAMTG